MELVKMQELTDISALETIDYATKGTAKVLNIGAVRLRCSRTAASGFQRTSDLYGGDASGAADQRYGQKAQRIPEGTETEAEFRQESALRQHRSLMA